MLQAKNILIIFMVNYVILLLVCCFIEIIFIGNAAQEAQLLMRTAADMALEQVQATDDFFITGGGYIMDAGTGSTLRTDVQGYKMKVLTTSGQYSQEYNMFEAITDKHETLSIFTHIYGPSKIGSWIDENPNVLEICFTAGVVEHTDSMIAGGGTIDAPVSALKMNWYQIPNLAQMGEAVTNGRTRMGFKMDGNKLVDNNVLTNIWNMYDLNNTAKDINVSGSEIKYFLSPLSLGITYINEDLVQAFFMNNLDLLMRAKYTNRNGYNLNTDPECGAGMLKGSFYSELVDTSSLQSLNPINNGTFTLLRGKQMDGTQYGVMLYEGIKPKIEYVVLDMYNQNAAQDPILQQIFGPRFSRDATHSYAGQVITGQHLWELDKDSIQNMKEVTKTTGSDVYDHKPIVVAKITFYADFVVPYMSPSIREMRGRVDNSNRISGRTLFNPFSDSQINVQNVQPIAGNYVDIIAKTQLMRGDIYNGVTRLGGNSDAMCYTTYFAVTP